MTVGIEVSGRAPSAGNFPGTSFREDAFTLEKRGWTSAGIDCAPKLAALAAAAQPSASEPIPIVSYVSRGNVLVIAGADASQARAAAEALSSKLSVTLAGAGGAPLGAVRVWNARVEALEGYLGEFTATIQGLEAADGGPVPAKFDLVLDFSQPPRFDIPLPPQGYHAAPGDEGAMEAILTELRESVGEFEKPRYFAYRENICAHSRSELVGCNACIEVCSTRAITSDGDHVSVDPHLCMGCGTCATVCPSGAMSYQFPRPSDRGTQLRHMLSAYASAGGTDASIVFHDANASESLAHAASTGRGLPAHALPLECWSVASVGLDILLPALALGASRVVILVDAAADVERRALEVQMAIGQAIVSGLGYPGRHFHVVEAGDERALDAALAAPAQVPASPAAFSVSNDKRTAIEFAVEHLAKHAPVPADEIALPQDAPFGEIRVDAKKCTMCMACVGACPESALMDGGDTPLLKFLERNCVQCGLCAETCPEDAITLSPRLLLTPAVREARVVNRAEPFHCIRCSKPFGTRQVVETMLGRLAGHSMFTGEGALRRLQMCADCRVVDMMSSKGEVSVLKLGGEA
jgi:ferredoxin